MNLATVISGQMSSMHAPFGIQNGARLNTHCLYPSNAMVQVAIMGQGSSYFVTDDGGAFKEAEHAGADLRNQDHKYKRLLEKQGLFMDRGTIYSTPVPIEAISAAILLVANASKEVADSIFQQWKIARERDFRILLRNMVKSEFKSVQVTEETIAGTSNKPHTFDNVVHFPDGSRLIIDAVLRDANSINSRLVANIDVRAAQYPRTVQRIVYDDTEDWQSADLSLLDISGVPVVAFSKSLPVLHQAIDLAA